MKQNILIKAEQQSDNIFLTFIFSNSVLDVFHFNNNEEMNAEAKVCIVYHAKCCAFFNNISNKSYCIFFLPIFQARPLLKGQLAIVFNIL